MKKILKFLLIAVLFSAFNLNAQEIMHQCGTTMEGPPMIFGQNQLSQARMMMENNEQYVFKVRINYVQNVVAEEEKEEKALDIVGVLNLYFNPVNIFFKYGGFQTYDNLELNYTGSQYPIYNNLIAPNLIEIFITETINYDPLTPNSITTAITLIENGIGRFIVINSDFTPIFNSIIPTKTQSVVHEMGHYLGLYHTFQKWMLFNGTYIASGIGCSYSDNNGNIYTTIMENLDGSEWNIFGDLVEDTAPDRVLSNYNISVYSDCSEINHSSAISNCGENIDFTIFNPPFQNFMSYSPSFLFDCRSEFTPGQVERMIAMINNTSLSNKLIDPIELYKPYASDFMPDYNNSITQEDPDNPEVLITCYQYKPRYQFQKGFDYSFLDWQGNVLTTKQPFEAPSLGHTQLRIEQLGTENINLWDILPDSWFLVPWVYGFCEEEEVIGGSVTTTPQLGSFNITRRDLTDEEATSPTLIDNLEPQKYHIIEKETESGHKTSKTVYKNE